MTKGTTLEARLEAVGAALRSRPSLSDRVIEALGESSCQEPTPRRTTHPQSVRMPLRRRSAALAAGTVLMSAVCLFVLAALVPSQSFGWADVAAAVRSQRWIRATVDIDERTSTMWLSPERQIWAFDLGQSRYFYDGQERAKYEYNSGDQQITKVSLGEQDAEMVLPLGALSQDASALGPWLFGTEKIVHQRRQEIVDGGQQWVEFHLVLWRGDMNHATLRVDPKTRLPVYLLHYAPHDTAASYKWMFDYPDDGPTDIYALGVPPGTSIENRMPSELAVHVLDGMAASRALLGDYRLLVGRAPGYPYAVVARKGDRWRVDYCWPQGAVDPLATPPAGLDWGAWYEKRLHLCHQSPQYICNGETVWENANLLDTETAPKWKASEHVAPQDMNSGDGLGSLPAAPYVNLAGLLFPNLWPRSGWEFELEPNLTDASEGVLVKRSARLASAEPLVGHEWYYVDPEKGYAVVRAELFTLPPDAPADPTATRLRQTLRMEDFRQSPGGGWYCTVVRDTRVAENGARAPSEPQFGGEREADQHPDAARKFKTTVRYHFEFNAELPDSIFEIEGTPVGNQ